jgi:hypothetical protein
MIEVYKIGLSYYDGLKSDKNSGLFEYDIIKQELKGINCKRKVLIVINGKCSEEENERVYKLLDNYDKKIFIMSDSIAMETCKNIMEKCDVVFHQRYNGIYGELNVRQVYSGIPELFYKYLYNRPRLLFGDRTDCINFGGNDLRREDKFELYNLADKIYNKRIKSYSQNYDTRVPHDVYIEELSQSKYALMICREEYRNIDWVTARFYEAIAVGCMPLVDKDFCRGLEGIFDGVIRVSDFEDIKLIMHNMTKEGFTEILNKLRYKCQRRKAIFITQIIREIGG